MRLSPALVALIAFVLAGALSFATARTAVAVVEYRSVDAVQDELNLQGHDWARVLGDGLQVILEGEAPTEAARFRAMSIAGGIVDASRVIDNLSVTDTAAIAPPDFAIEILRNDSGVSLIGLIPASTDREALNARIATIAGGQPVTDLLQSADYPVPDDWRPALDYALTALGQLPRSKISVAAGAVAVHAISNSATQQRRLETDLLRSRPDGVTVELTITAPRPVITPFTVRFVIDDRGPRFEACSAESDGTQALILAAAQAAGATGPMSCVIGLGVPTPEWGDAVSEGIAALAEIGQGTITFADADVALVAAEGTDPAVFDRVAGALANSLPEVFAVEATLLRAPEAGEEGPPEFTAARDEDGAVTVAGRVQDDLMNMTVQNFAQARFGASAVSMATRVTADGLPPGWSVRVLAGLEVLSMLEHGAVTVQPGLVTVTGVSGSATANDDIARLLIDKLGASAEFDIDVSYEERLDPTAGLPTPEECVAQIAVVTDGRKITFDPGSANLAADTLPIIDDIAEILERCIDVPILIAGFTDSQGGEEMNRSLSQSRAEAVLSALRARRVPVGSFVAQGFGEADPIADNETEEGREANRRIEFKLIVPEAEAEAADPATTEAAEGEDAEAEATEAEAAEPAE